MKRYLWPTIIILIIVVIAAFLWLQGRSYNPPIGGQRDAHGCLGPAGYAFDNEVGACIRAFEMTPDIKRAAGLAVKQVGQGYALTVVSFNSYEEVGAYDIVLERGLERTKETVYIRNWRPSPAPYPDTPRAIQAILAEKYSRPLAEVHVTVTKEVQGYAAGSVLFGQGGPGEGGMWLAVLGNSWSVVWDGNGSIDCNKMRQEYGIPDTILKPNFCD